MEEGERWRYGGEDRRAPYNYNHTHKTHSSLEVIDLLDLVQTKTLRATTQKYEREIQIVEGGNGRG